MCGACRHDHADRNGLTMLDNTVSCECFYSMTEGMTQVKQSPYTMLFFVIFYNIALIWQDIIMA